VAGLLITGGRIIDPDSGFDRIADVAVSERSIVGLGEAPVGFTPDRLIDASGCLVIPGLIDLGTHLREPGAEHKACIASEVRAAAAGGITCLCASPATDPVTDSTAVVELLTRRARQAHRSRVMPIAALTRGLEGMLLSEMAALRDAGCVAVSDGGKPVRDTQVLLRALEYAATCKLPVLLTPRDPDLSPAAGVHDGWVATRLGLRGIPVAAETTALGRYLALVEQTGTQVHFTRLSSARGAQMVATARARGLPVSGDVAIHQLFLSEMDLSGFDTRCHVSPPLRSDADREALRQGLASGAIQAVCSDHQPHDEDAKACTFEGSEPGISGLDTLLSLLLRLVDDGVLDLRTALARATCDPARILGLPRGRIAVGGSADLCVVDPDAHRWFSVEQMHSAGRNTPFAGWDLPGAVRWTLLEGRVIHGD
jgi:dihydroorotase